MKRSSARRALLACVTAALLTVPPGTAGADDRDPRDREAQRRFKNAVELYQDGDPRGAMVEFRRAYDSSPNFRVLYNLGQVAYELGDWATARGYFRRYLDEGGSEVPSARRREVEQTLESLSRRIGQVVVVVESTAAGPGAQILLDDVVAGTVPLAAPLEVNVGKHKVTLVTPGSAPEARSVEIGGGETSRLVFRAAGGNRLSGAAASEDRKRSPERTSPLTLRAPAAPAAATGLDRDSWLQVGWVATGVLGAATVGSAVLAFSASRTLRDDRDKYPIDAQTLSDDHSRVRTWSLVADVLLVTTLATGATTWLLSSRDGRDRKGTATGGRTPLRVGLAPGGLSVAGGF